MKTDGIGLWLPLLALTACGLDASPIKPASQAATALADAAVQTGDPLPTMSTCPSGDGMYCGGHGFAADEHVVYRCVAGEFSIVSVCADGCEPVAAGGEDRCRLASAQAGASASTGAPAAGATAVSMPGPAGAGASARAGAAAPSGGIGAAANGGGGAPAASGGAGAHATGAAGHALAAGSGGRASTAHAGAGGHAGGVAQPTSCPNGDGDYCGAHTIGGDRTTLYACAEGKLTRATRCPYGCQAVGKGGHDHCQQPPDQGPGGPGMPPGWPPQGPGPVPQN